MLYRLIAEINYPKGWVFIKFIGTLPNIDKVDAEKSICSGPKRENTFKYETQILKTKRGIS